MDKFNNPREFWPLPPLDDDEQESENERLRAALEDLIPLAEAAMREANRDGAEYDTDAELREARRAIGGGDR
jgi:hypothetical protein